VLRQEARALCALYVKLELPFARKAAGVACYADAKRLINQSAEAAAAIDIDDFFGPRSVDMYGANVLVPTHTDRNITARCRALARQRLFLGCVSDCSCTICKVGSVNGSMIQCDKCGSWFHLMCYAFSSCEASDGEWLCRTCRGEPRPDTRVPVELLPCERTDGVPYNKMVHAVQLQFDLEKRLWATCDDNVSAWLSLSCPFTADSTEGPMGLLKSNRVGSQQRTETMLRGLLMSRKYNTDWAEVDCVVPAVKHMRTLRSMAASIGARESKKNRQPDRVLPVLNGLEKQASTDKKRKRISDCSSERCEDVEDIMSLVDSMKGSKAALQHQAQLWGVSQRGTRLELANRIVGKIEETDSSSD